MTICKKCLNDFNIKAEKNVTYLGIDEHHNPPEFMFEKDEIWFGEMVSLCRKCHRELHDNLIEIMLKHSTLFKKNKSEYWIWLHTSLNERKKCREECYNFTNEWLNNKGVDDGAGSI